MGDPVTFAVAYLFATGGICFLVGCGIWALVRRREPRTFREELLARLPDHAVEERLAAIEESIARLTAVTDRLQEEMAKKNKVGTPVEEKTQEEIWRAYRQGRNLEALAGEMRRPKGELQLIVNLRRLRAQ